MLLTIPAGRIHAQGIPVQLEQAIESRNVSGLAKMFDDRLEISLDGEMKDYSGKQAQVVLNEFLGKFSKVSFDIIHEGISRNQSKYYIGKMIADGQEYRVYLYVKQDNGQDFVQEMKFEKQ